MLDFFVQAGGLKRRCAPLRRARFRTLPGGKLLVGPFVEFFPEFMGTIGVGIRQSHEA